MFLSNLEKNHDSLRSFIDGELEQSTLSTGQRYSERPRIYSNDLNAKNPNYHTPIGRKFQDTNPSKQISLDNYHNQISQNSISGILAHPSGSRDEKNNNFNNNEISSSDLFREFDQLRHQIKNIEESIKQNADHSNRVSFHQLGNIKQIHNSQINAQFEKQKYEAFINSSAQGRNLPFSGGGTYTQKSVMFSDQKNQNNGELTQNELEVDDGRQNTNPKRVTIYSYHSNESDQSERQSQERARKSLSRDQEHLQNGYNREEKGKNKQRDNSQQQYLQDIEREIKMAEQELKKSILQRKEDSSRRRRTEQSSSPKRNSSQQNINTQFSYIGPSFSPSKQNSLIMTVSILEERVSQVQTQLKLQLESNTVLEHQIEKGQQKLEQMERIFIKKSNKLKNYNRLEENFQKGEEIRKNQQKLISVLKNDIQDQKSTKKPNQKK